MKRIAIFASGGGSNALKFIEHFDSVSDIEVALVVTNRKTAGVLNHAHAYNVSTLIVNRPYFYDTTNIIAVMKSEQIDMIVLAGFLWLIPPYLVKAFPDKIVNIHPALLPKYGGKGMYGKHVHKAVKEAGETESGITIHFVNERYDDGNHIFQATCSIDQTDSAETIASKVLTLEHKHFAEQVHLLLS